MIEFPQADRTDRYQDLMAKPGVVDQRIETAMQLGTLLVRMLDHMNSDAKIPEQTFALGSSGADFEIVVRRKKK